MRIAAKKLIHKTSSNHATNHSYTYYLLHYFYFSIFSPLWITLSKFWRVVGGIIILNFFLKSLSCLGQNRETSQKPFHVLKNLGNVLFCKICGSWRCKGQFKNPLEKIRKPNSLLKRCLSSLSLCSIPSQSKGSIMFQKLHLT